MVASERPALGEYLLDEVVETDPVTVTRRARRNTAGATGRPLLIRTLKPGVEPKPDLLRALERERDLLLRIDHPALTTLVDAFTADGAPVLVLLDHGGHRLAELLRRSSGALDWRFAAAIALELARALAALHNAGAAHGCLDASVVELSERGTVHLHGLGRLQALGELCPPDRMAPEQILGDPPDAASDVFQLGALLFRMAAGREPFEARGDSSVAQQIRRASAPPLGRYSPGVPAELERIVARCLAKRPRDRFADMSALASALGAVLRTDTTAPSDLLVAAALGRAGLASETARPELGDSGPRGSAASRRTRLFALGGGALALLAIGLAYVGMSGADAPSGPGGPKGIAEQPAEVRVLARPWAEIHVDGRPIDTTPRARPIELSPGRHTIVLKHPNAPDESRTLELIAGQKALIDVDMKVSRPPTDAGAPDAGAEDTP